MSKRKGLSMDEKGAKLLEIFHEAGEVFSIKEIEKLGPKKGVIAQSIKDVIQALVNDDLVHMEKIGSSNFYWSFPSEQTVKLSTTILQTEQQTEGLRQKRAKLEAEVDRRKVGQEDAALRSELTASLSALRQEVASIESTLESYRDQDPETIRAIGEGTELAKASANRWLDNTHCLASWCKKKFPNMEEALTGLYKEHNYSDSLDYVS